jgi:hypothetical protein
LKFLLRRDTEKEREREIGYEWVLPYFSGFREGYGMSKCYQQPLGVFEGNMNREMCQQLERDQEAKGGCLICLFKMAHL